MVFRRFSQALAGGFCLFDDTFKLVPLNIFQNSLQLPRRPEFRSVHVLLADAVKWFEWDSGYGSSVFPAPRSSVNACASGFSKVCRGSGPRNAAVRER